MSRAFRSSFTRSAIFQAKPAKCLSVNGLSALGIAILPSGIAIRKESFAVREGGTQVLEPGIAIPGLGTTVLKTGIPVPRLGIAIPRLGIAISWDWNWVTSTHEFTVECVFAPEERDVLLLRALALARIIHESGHGGVRRADDR